MKITMLGSLGAGKTTYMTALFERMLFNSAHGHKILLKRANGDFLSRLGEIARLKNYSFEQLDSQFPESTGQTTEFEFDVYRIGGKNGKEKICDFEWIDYRGGLIDDILNLRTATPESMDVKEIEEFASHVLNSHSLLIFVDAEELIRHQSVYRLRKKTGADHISAVLNTIFFDNPAHELGIVLMVSKIDSGLLDSDRKNKYSSCIEKTKRVYNNLIELCQNSRGRWQIKMGLVGSIGVGNVETVEDEKGRISNKIIADPDPLDVEYPLFMLMQVPIDRQLDECEQRLRRLTQYRIYSGSSEEKEARILADKIRKLETYRESIRRIHHEKLLNL